ncbi:hypothetical protein DPEC_G00363490 [Dallia pectoralis]|nr:hypothetical protein DPEC_G00363490 [Dallia pectoralis]
MPIQNTQHQQPRPLETSRLLQYHAGLASSLLNQQSLKRSANQMGASAKRRPKVQPSTLVLPPQYVDDVISRIGRMFPDMSIELFRPNGTSAVLLLVSPITVSPSPGRVIPPVSLSPGWLVYHPVVCGRWAGYLSFLPSASLSRAATALVTLRQSASGWLSFRHRAGYSVTLSSVVIELAITCAVCGHRLVVSIIQSASAHRAGGCHHPQSACNTGLAIHALSNTGRCHHPVSSVVTGLVVPVSQAGPQFSLQQQMGSSAILIKEPVISS